MRNKLLLTGFMLALVACGAPENEQYCRSFGVEGTPEFTKCLSYYAQQDALFSNDRAVCELQADETYPPTLYDHGSTGQTMGGFGPRGEFYSGQTIYIDPDWQKNQEIDRLRMRIIGPCMQAKGWNSPSDWKAGRHAGGGRVLPVSVPAPAQKLPWQR